MDDVLKATYPCCDKRMRLKDAGLPLQAWERRCRPCNTTWLVRIVFRMEPIPGMVVTSLEFTDTMSTEYRHHYGT